MCAETIGRFTGADGEHRTGGLGNNVVGRRKRNMAGPAAAFFATHDNQVGGAVLSHVQDLLGRVAKAHAKFRGDEGAVGSAQRLAHALRMDLAKVLKRLARSGLGIFQNVQRG